MPLYFFDIDDSVSIRDEVGTELPDRHAAQAEAFRRAAEYGGDPAKLTAHGVIVVTVRSPPDAVALKVRLICQVEDGRAASTADVAPDR